MPPDTPRTVEALTAALAEPFDAAEVKSKPAAVSGNRAMAIFYVDARVIQDRLDEVLGVAGWSDDYEVLSDSSVVCRLRCRLGEEWITKVDVGSPSEQPDSGDRMKAAFSDALKRAAVKFGLGRYLYRLPAQWVDYDPQKRRFVKEPQLPRFAQPAKAQATSAVPPAEAPAAEAPTTTPREKPPIVPVSGAQLLERVSKRDTYLHKQGTIRAGEALTALNQFGADRRLGKDVTGWTERQVTEALEFMRQWEARKLEGKAAAG